MSSILAPWGQYRSEPVEVMWEKYERPEFWPTLGLKVALKLGPLKPILSPPQSIRTEHVNQYWYETTENFLRKWWQQFWSILGHAIRVFWCPYSTHITYKSSYNEHVKQYWCATSGIILIKCPMALILDLFCRHNFGPLRPILYISLSIFNEHIEHDWCKFRGNFYCQIIENPNFHLFGCPKWPKDLGLFYTVTKLFKRANKSSFE